MALDHSCLAPFRLGLFSFSRLRPSSLFSSPSVTFTSASLDSIPPPRLQRLFSLPLLTFLTAVENLITRDDSASLLEKIVEYDCLRNLIDLKRRLGVGRHYFGYFHPAIPGEPLIFIEVAILKTLLPPFRRSYGMILQLLNAKPIVPYSISSTQPGLAGINLGKFLLKRVIDMVKRDIPSVQKYVTLSPIPGFMQWLNSKLASQLKLSQSEAGGSTQSENWHRTTFRESILLSHVR